MPVRDSIYLKNDGLIFDKVASYRALINSDAGIFKIL